MTWDDLRKFVDRPAAYVSDHTHGDLIVVGPSHDAIRAYLAAHPREGQEGPADFTTLHAIFGVYDGDLFDEGGGSITFI